jgi:hypothetical protein
MFQQIADTCDVLRECGATLMPAFKGCIACESVAMIASPDLGKCATCGADLTVLTDRTMRASLSSRGSIATATSAA